jgi:hypothetical protein
VASAIEIEHDSIVSQSASLRSLDDVGARGIEGTSVGCQPSNRPLNQASAKQEWLIGQGGRGADPCR